jgi:hypothetical protein
MAKLSVMSLWGRLSPGRSNDSTVQTPRFLPDMLRQSFHAVSNGLQFGPANVFQPVVDDSGEFQKRLALRASVVQTHLCQPLLLTILNELDASDARVEAFFQDVQLLRLPAIDGRQ